MESSTRGRHNMFLTLNSKTGSCWSSQPSFSSCLFICYLCKSVSYQSEFSVFLFCWKYTSELPICGYTMVCYVKGEYVWVHLSVCPHEEGKQKRQSSLQQKFPDFLGYSSDFGWVFSLQASAQTHPSSWTPASSIAQATAVLSSSQLYLATDHVTPDQTAVWLCRQCS